MEQCIRVNYSVARRLEADKGMTRVSGVRSTSGHGGDGYVPVCEKVSGGSSRSLLGLGLSGLRFLWVDIGILRLLVSLWVGYCLVPRFSRLARQSPFLHAQ
jgi:hypothetical protein